MKNRLTLFSLGFLFGTALISAAQAADIRQGLVSHWPLDANDGGTALDFGLGNHMAITGSPVVGPGKFNNAFTFDGSTTYLLNPHTTDNSVNGLPIYRAGRYTVMMWVKGAAQTSKYIFTEGATNSTAPLFILQTGNAANNSKLDVIIRPDTGAAPIDHRVSTNVVFDNTWHHIAWVDDRGSVKLYVDGNLDPANFNYVPAGTFTFHTTVIASLIRTTVATGNIFNGQIDDVAVWERPLTQSEVQQVMTSSLPSTPPFITLEPIGGPRAVADRITFRTRAVGSPPVTYQWFNGDTPIPDATSRTLALSNLTLADSGNYTVQVSNPGGSVTSVVATLTVVADPAPDIRRALVSHWPFDVIEVDEFAQENTPDLYSNNDMAVFHPLSFIDQVTGAFDNAIVFNGADQYGLRRGGFPIYNNLAYSVSLWVNATGTGQSDLRFFSEGSTNNNNPLFCFGTHNTGADGTIRVFIRSDSGTALMIRNSTRTALDGTWHHVVWTETNGLARLYIDGVLDETDFDYSRSALTLSQTSVGAIVRAAVGSYFAGALDEVAVWNRALTLTEIQEIRTAGIPPPIAAIPPEIMQHPTNQSVFTRSRVTFSFTATGTSPLAAQWRKNGEDLPGEVNPTLFFSNVALTDAGEYTVVVSNSGGRATSEVATLTVTLRPPAPTELKIDFNNTGQDTPAETEPGFLTFSLPGAGVGPFTKNFGGADLTVSGAGGIGLQSRRRLVPVNSGAFTESQLLLDFIVSSDTNSGQGMDVVVEFMEESTPYTVSIWSYDNSSQGVDRISDWSANGTVVRSSYSFFGSNLPVDNNTYRFDFDTISDSDGKILIEGRRSALATGTFHVFVNALKVIRRELRVKRIQILDFDISLTIELLNPAATHRIEEKVNLDDENWTEVIDAFFSPPVGNSQVVLFPTPVMGPRFYRVVQVQ